MEPGRYLHHGTDRAYCPGILCREVEPVKREFFYLILFWVLFGLLCWFLNGAVFT